MTFYQQVRNNFSKKKKNLLYRENWVGGEEYSYYYVAAAAAAKSLQSCPTLCDPHRRQPTRLRCPWDSPGKNTGVGCHFLLQCMKVKRESEVTQSVRLFMAPWTAAHQAPLSMGFSRQEYWSGVPLPSPIIMLFVGKTDTYQKCYLLK